MFNYEKSEEYKEAMNNLTRSIVIHRDDPMYNDIVNIGFGVYDTPYDNKCWLSIMHQDKNIIIDDFKEMHELWSAIKEITEKAEALCNERVKAKETK